MNILYIANIRLPTEKAHGIQIMKMCEAFARVGHTVKLVVPTRHNHIKETPFKYYGVDSVFAIKTLPIPDFVHIGKIGFLVSLFTFSIFTTLTKSFWSTDIVYSRDALVLFCYLLLGRKIIYEAHTKPSLVARFVAHRVHKIVVISKALRAEYIAIGIDKKDVIVATDAVDTSLFSISQSRFSLRKELSVPTSTKIVMYTGHLYARKGAEVLVNTAIHFPYIQFYFVGGTADDIARFNLEWKDRTNIHIVGHVLPTEVPKYLRLADILVIPNSNKSKDSSVFTSPMKLFEYMASGTPIVASDVQSIREILTNEDATFFTPDDTHALAEAIKAVFSDEKTAQEKAKNALQKAKKYTWDKRAKYLTKQI